jgi:hypothetical protein
MVPSTVKHGPEKMVSSHGRDVPQHTDRREKYEAVLRRKAALQGGGLRAPGPTGRPTEAPITSLKPAAMAAAKRDPRVLHPLQKQGSVLAFFDEWEKIIAA